jgi:S-adenosyl-L-methionine hydrolase (adenosine-forming)
MSDPLITLTTDFGEESPYVAAMKGVILGINPAARLVALTHQVPPQDVWYTLFFLAGAVPYFPAGTLHVVVVDPGVGSGRAILYVEVEGQRLLVPDNGCWTSLRKPRGPAPRVIRLAKPRYWRRPVSATFHGRDIFAPVAAHLSLGVDPANLGPPVTEWAEASLPRPKLRPDRLAGEVVFVDHFGNLITNIPGKALARFAGSPVRIRAAGHDVPRLIHTYSDVVPGELAALVSSAGTLEVAVYGGSAAKQLQAGVGAGVEVTRDKKP